jgi:hypothetical protein
MRHKGITGDRFSAQAHRRAGLGGNGNLEGYWEIVCRDKNGKEKWRDVIHNLVVNVGLDHLLDVALSGGTPDTTWFVGLTDGTPTVAAADTMASHSGWVEVTAYDEANRVPWVEAGVSSQVITNSASPAVFTISSDSTTIGGAFLAADNTKGGSSGILMAAGAFSAGDKTLDDNDTLDVTLSITASSS